MLDLITEIRDRGETTLLLSSHLLKDVEGVCDQVLILKQGRVAAVTDLAAERRTDRSFVELELGGASPTFVDALRARGCELAMTDDTRLKAVLPEGVTVRTVFELAAEGGVLLRRLNVSQDSLQDIFLRVLEDDRGGV
jgi:ABC-2 type transport system ATP-binding protein